MKRVTYVVTPQQGYFDPTEIRCRENDVRIDAIHDVDVHADGTVNVLLEVTATQSQIRTCFPGDAPRLVNRAISTGGGTTMVQLRYEPTEPNRRFLEPHRTHGVVVQYPMTVVDPDRSSLRVTVFGPDADVQDLVSETRVLGDFVVENVTSYCPSTNQYVDALTDRQQEVLVTAYEQGYYETPRNATYDDVAAELDCSASSVGQILRRSESALVTAAIADRRLESA